MNQRIQRAMKNVSDQGKGKCEAAPLGSCSKLAPYVVDRRGAGFILRLRHATDAGRPAYCLEHGADAMGRANVRDD